MSEIKSISRFEAFFKNYAVMKGRNRNTTWLRIVQEDWPEVNRIYEEWIGLALAGNHQSLSKMMEQRTGINQALFLWVNR